MYIYRLYFTDALLVCANPLGSVVVLQTEELPDLATPLLSRKDSWVSAGASAVAFN